MSCEKAVLLLGRRDEPTDGVADYCEKLREAASRRGLCFEIAAVPWAEKGWRDSLVDFRNAAAAWRDRWVFLQFTTLAWSRRGFPMRAPRLLEILQQCGARPGIVFHDLMPVRGSGIAGHVRAYSQLRVFRQLYARSNLVVFTVPLDKIKWLPPRHDQTIFIPVGSNFPELDPGFKDYEGLHSTILTVAVFGITGGPRGLEEVGDIAYALRGVQSKGIRLRLIAIGRGTPVFEEALQKALNESGIELSTLGLMGAQELAQALAGAHVLLCVRGHVSSRRGSAIAGIVCGVPIVGYRGAETGFPITESGVILVDEGDRQGLVKALAQVLRDEELHAELRQRNLRAVRQYFGWDAIASQFIQAISAR